uniref:Uncharacterized protein L09DR n=1 Tax=African swine fever virus TaxID=10497 RepID=Q8V9U1_ASF|nr:putative protein [African swine fever virus]
MASSFKMSSRRAKICTIEEYFSIFFSHHSRRCLAKLLTLLLIKYTMACWKPSKIKSPSKRSSAKRRWMLV